jgi:lysophospholipase L1-like esterase
MLLKQVVRERLPDWVQPFGDLKIVFMSILPPSNPSAFLSTLDPETPADRRTAFNAALQEVAAQTNNLYLDRDLEVKDPSDYRLPTPYDGYLPSRQAAAKITKQLAKLVYPHIIDLTQNKSKR